MSLFQDYQQEIKKWLGHEHQVFLFWKGRVALYAILRALGLQEGDEVLVPALTCVVVPNAIIYLGGRPVYVDVDPHTNNLDISRLETEVTSRTKVILAQNTFGLSSDLDPICALAKKHNLWVIEDCAHGFGGTYKGRPNGTVADASFFSTQWNKTFSTGIGGFAVIRNHELTDRMHTVTDEASAPGFREEMSLRLQLLIKKVFLNQSTYWAALGAYRWLSKHNLVTGSSAGQELSSPAMPKGYMKKAGLVQAKHGIRQLRLLQENLSHRKKIAQAYDQICCRLNVEPPFVPDYAGHTLIQYPLLVKDRPGFFREAEKHRIELGDWFLSPIHPVMSDFEKWNYLYGKNPVAETLSQSLVNLPTHMNIDDSYLARVERFLEKNRKHIFSSVQECLTWQTRL